MRGFIASASGASNLSGLQQRPDPWSRLDWSVPGADVISAAGSIEWTSGSHNSSFNIHVPAWPPSSIARGVLGGSPPGRVRRAPGTRDFAVVAGASAQALRLSAGLAALPANGRVSLVNRVLTLTPPAGQPLLTVWRLRHDLVYGASNVTINFNRAGWGVINLVGSAPGGQARLKNIIVAGSVTEPEQMRRLVLNVVDATLVRMNNTSWRGTVLAPRSAYVGHAGGGRGAVIARSIQATGGNYLAKPFCGCPLQQPQLRVVWLSVSDSAWPLPGAGARNATVVLG